MLLWLKLGLWLALADLVIIVPAKGFFERKLSLFRDRNRPVQLKHWIMIAKGFAKRYPDFMQYYFGLPLAYKCDFRNQWLWLFGVRGWYAITRIHGMKLNIIELFVLKWRYRLFPKTIPKKARKILEIADRLNRGLPIE